MATGLLEQPLAWTQRVWERHGARLPGLATAVFTMLLAVALAQAVWLLLPAPESARWTPMPAAPKASANNSRRADVAGIVGAHLFGIYQPTVISSQSAREAPDTPLNLTLMGIFAGTSADYSRALIAQVGGSEQPYSQGDRISAGVILQKILTDRVILLRDGRLETLRLEKDRPSSADAPAAVETASAEPGSGQDLARIRDEVLRDPAKAGEYLRVQPANLGGQLHGYRVYPGNNRAAFTNSGLRPGDLITSVNGVELNDAGRALQLLGQLAQSPQINMTVERGGQTQTINLNLN